MSKASRDHSYCNISCKVFFGFITVNFMGKGIVDILRGNLVSYRGSSFVARLAETSETSGNLKDKDFGDLKFSTSNTNPSVISTHEQH